MKTLIIAATYLLYAAIPLRGNYPVISDSLENLNYDQLYQRIRNSKNTPEKSEMYLSVFLRKAKKENNILEIVNGYKYYMYRSPDQINMIYADSMIMSSLQTSENALISSAFLSRGIAYYSKKKYNQALDDYLRAQDYAVRTNDEYLIHKISYNIGNLKYYLGSYSEAIEIFEKCVSFFKDDNPKAYLNTLHALSLCYNKTGKYDLSSEINYHGISEGKRLSQTFMESYFRHLEGINHYFKNNYDSAIHFIKTSLPDITDNGDFANESVAHFYIGISYWEMNNLSEAIKHFNAVDEILREKNYIREDLTEGYRLLINHYKNNNDLEKQLFYTKRLVTADSLLKVNYQNLMPKIHKNYDIKNVMAQKDNMEKGSHRKDKKINLLLLLVISLLIILTLIIYSYFYQRKKLRHRYEVLIKKEKIIHKTKNEIKAASDKSIESLLYQLEKFENDQKFLEQNLTLVKLAARFNSNTKYLSYVIHNHKNNSFTNYLNSLRVNYIIQQLKNNKKLRQYTTLALSEEAGFTSKQRFVVAFKSITGITPAFFISNLKKDDK
ncbi:AraC family transcriptional regulator [Moheibacter lacus]|uniref:Helix-turn-helix domain-containing protein n=1 Tax=Moheibacter lacus TaxID=2745851 RepID=A0A838ZTT6_9FLAO|nr:AraC family transcriptional regulator [Moheibacter lacus]MBA5630343.1 helix-turn-helix domain-containing protein [Moheibacter lacus]